MISIGGSRLFNTTFLSVLIAGLLPLILLSLIAYHIFADSLESHIKASLVSIADNKYALLKARLDAIASFTTERATGPTPVAAIEKLTKAFKSGGIDSEEYRLLDAKYREAFQRYFDANGDIYDMLFISPDGYVIFSMLHEDDFAGNVNEGLLKDSALPGLLDITAATLSTSISEALFYPPTGSPAVFIAAPVIGDGKFLGIMAFQIKPRLWYSVAENYVGLPRTGDIAMAAIIGDEMVYVTPLRFRPDAAFNYKFGVSQMPQAMNKALGGEIGLGFTKDYRAREVLARWQYIPQLGWGMVVKADKEEIFAPVRNLEKMIYLLSVIMIMGMLLLTISLANRVIEPVMLLKKKSESMGRGEYGSGIKIDLDNELGDLAASFNKMADDLKNLQEKAVRSEKLSAIGKLASGVAHELRNPLGVMKNAVYYINMLGPSKLSSEVRENLEIISYEIDKSDRIISDILDFVRAHKPVLKPFSINDIIDEVMNRVARFPNIEFVLELDQSLPMVNMDALQIHQVFYNIVKNAIDAIKKNGTLTIKTGRDGDFAYASFKDTGCGISKENMTKLFEPLYSTKTDGTGLGLSICDHLIGMHGGTIAVESEPGKGSTFTVKLPVDRKA